MEGIHWSHPGRGLVLKNSEQIYKCNGCKESGIGRGYRCEQCDYNLHKECLLPKCEDNLFKSSIFEFYGQLPYDRDGRRLERICDMCGKPVTGFGYFCKEDDRCLHPFCHTFPSRLEVDDRVVDFKLLDKDAALSSSKCLWCKKKRLEGSTVSGNIPGWFYVSKCDGYHFHVYCCNEMIMLGNSLEKGIRGFLKTKRRSTTKAISSKKKNMSMAMMFVITNPCLHAFLSSFSKLERENLFGNGRTLYPCLGVILEIKEYISLLVPLRIWLDWFVLSVNALLR
ncbi:hypothetical protein QYF36_006464 [Acer negundo]|nr:hypothetical protein QYF36_006464 [Acer negundo]